MMGGGTTGTTTTSTVRVIYAVLRVVCLIHSNYYVIPTYSFTATVPCYKHQHHHENRIQRQRHHHIFTNHHPSKYASSSSLLSSSLSSEEEDAVRQWELLSKHHAKGRWRGTWTSYDYMGDEIDSTKASVILSPTDEDVITHVHEIVTGGSQKSDCDTCFDAEDVRTIPVADYRPGRLGRQRLASVGAVTGPSLLRSGAMTTELVLSHSQPSEGGDRSSRLRVTFFHGPCWPDGVEPNTCPPSGLKLYRTVLSREVLEDATSNTNDNDNQDLFTQPVPPFQWHAAWSGTSWTYGPQSGDRGWRVEQMEEADAWHGRPTGDDDNVWSLRFNRGGVLLQCPRVVYGGTVGLCRLAWLVSSSDNDETTRLLRIEAGVSALDPVEDDDDETKMVGFMPPRLVSLRCDTLLKTGELEGTSLLEREAQAKKQEDQISSLKTDIAAAETDSDKEVPAENEDGLDAVRKALENLL